MANDINAVTSGVTPPLNLKELSSQETAHSRSGVAASVKNTTANPVHGTQSVAKSELEKQVQELQDVANQKNWSVSFSVDTELDHTVIKVFDSKTKELIRQIPNEEWLDTAKKLKVFNESINNKTSNISQDGVSGFLLDKQI